MNRNHTLTIHQINTTLATMERQWGEPYKRGNIFTAIIAGAIITWGVPLTAVWLVFRGH